MSYNKNSNHSQSANRIQQSPYYTTNPNNHTNRSNNQGMYTNTQ